MIVTPGGPTMPAPQSGKLSCQKPLFSLPDDLHYLNCAYMAPYTREVEVAGTAAIRRFRNPAEVHTEHFFDASTELRTLFARLVGAEDLQRIAIIPSVSYGIAAVANNLELQAGQNIVLTHQQFPSNVYVWRRFEARGVDLRFVEPPATRQRRGEGWSERILEAIDEATAVVTLGHVHWTDGTRFDLDEIGRRARQVGAALIIDGTQSVGALPFDIGCYRPDALVCAGYKWLLGPYGIGMAYYGPRFDGGTPLEEGWIARRGNEDFSRLVDYQDDYQPGALRYDVGERSSFVLLPMLKQALEHLLAWGAEAIQAYCRALTRELVAEAPTLGYGLEADTWRGDHLFGLRLPDGLDPHSLRRSLADRNVAVSVRGDAVRISPHVYNDAADLTALLQALQQASPMRQHR